MTTEQRATVKVWQREHHWHPNQLRHAFETLVRKQRTAWLTRRLEAMTPEERAILDRAVGILDAMADQAGP